MARTWPGNFLQMLEMGKEEKKHEWMDLEVYAEIEWLNMVQFFWGKVTEIVNEVRSEESIE